MTKFDIMLLITRLNGKAIYVSPIDDIYTDCQIKLDAKYLTDEDILNFYSHMTEKYRQDMLQNIRTTTGYLYNEGEAKDLTCELSQYSIKIEHKEVEIEEK